MPEKTVDVIIEFDQSQKSAFRSFAAAVATDEERATKVGTLLDRVAGAGVETHEYSVPIPMLSGSAGLTRHQRAKLATFSEKKVSDDLASSTIAIEVKAKASQLEKLQGRPDLRVWPSSPLTMFASSRRRARKPMVVADCQYAAVATIDEVRKLLRVEPLWSAGYKGRGIVVAIVDDGINAKTYPIAGGYDVPMSHPVPGTAPITSHGSMCASDVLVCAPEAQLLDYPMLSASSGSALRMYQHILNRRRDTGTPHLASNSYGYVSMPPKTQFPTHEVHDINHPFNRKVAEVTASGISCFFAAGNCGKDCADPRCETSGVGPGKSIHAANSLEQVITVAAVNKTSQRIGYSSQGPGIFFAEKPDIACFSHFYAHLGPGRPGGGGAKSFDSGTSAATPLAAGVGALLVQAFPKVSAAALREALLRSAWRSGSSGWDRDIGHGIIDALSAWEYLDG